MIKVIYSQDSKKRGTQTTHRTLASAKRSIKCHRGKHVSLNRGRDRIHGYPKSWEVVCGDTVIADILQLPRGKREDYYPTYSILDGTKRKAQRRGL
jgi:hypothetical protein